MYYEDSINVYHFIARVAYQLAQALHIDVHEYTYWHIHIDTTPNKNAEGSHPWCSIFQANV